jgi:hypothetical protein
MANPVIGTIHPDLPDGLGGIFRPPDDPRLPFFLCPRLYFSAHFLSNPDMGYTVVRPKDEDNPFPPDGVPPGQRFRTWKWPKGTKVIRWLPDQAQDCRCGRDHGDRVIWVLTGIWFPLTTTTAYEGKWPD